MHQEPILVTRNKDVEHIVNADDLNHNREVQMHNMVDRTFTAIPY